MSLRSFVITAGTQGIRIDVPDSVELLAVQSPIDPAPVLSVTQQQELIRTAFVNSASGQPLRELAKGKRRVAVLLGDLSQPAPYDIVLPELIQALVDADIRPSRIAFLVYPGNGAPVLGRGAIRRYGEHAVGDPELNAWAEADPIFVDADLHIAVRPLLANTPALPASKPIDLDIRISLGQKTTMDISAVNAYSGVPLPEWPAPNVTQAADNAPVWLSGGGGGEWELTLEEALLSLAQAPLDTQTKTAVLGFSGEDGLGSARFVNDLWSLLGEAEQMLARDGVLPPMPDSPGAPFDPAGVVAESIARFSNLILFSPTFMEHPEGDDLADRLLEWPHAATRIQLCGSQAALWSALAKLHGETSRLSLEPLGWRRFALK